MTDGERQCLSEGVYWCADEIFEIIRRNPYMACNPLLKSLAKKFERAALENELPLLVKRKWAFLNDPKPVFSQECVVDNHGTITPSFPIPVGADLFHWTAGYLKYFHMYAGKKVKVTVEILD